MTSDTGVLNINGLSGQYFIIPPCLATKTSVYRVQVTSGVLVQDFANFPSTLYDLNLYSSRFAPSASDGSNLGFDADGNVDWTEIFQRFSLAQFAARDSNLRGSLPESLPPKMGTFELTSSQMSGTIPASFFSNVFAYSGSNPYVLVLADGNKFTGTIPPTLFSGYPKSKFQSFQVHFSLATARSLVPSHLISSSH